MRYRLSVIPARVVFLGLGFLELAGVYLIVRYAQAPDDYYGDGTTHWEHAMNGGGAWYAVVLGIIAALIAAGFLAKGLFPQRLRLWRFGILGFVGYLVTLYAAFFFLTVGH